MFFRRFNALQIPFAILLLLVAGCEPGTDPLPNPEPSRDADLTVQAQLAGERIATVVVEVTASDITTPIVANLTIVDSTASGTITVPTGTDRVFTVRAYETGGIETHRGADTLTVNEGTNPAVVIRLAPLSGDQPIDVVIGTIYVDVTPATATIEIGEDGQLTAEVTDEMANVLDVDVTWATLAPHLATVTTTGLVTGVAAGDAQIVATYAGSGGSATVTVEADPSFIVFDYYDGSNRDIYRIEPDGTGLTQLTTHVGSNPFTSNEYPSLSHDRTTIAFSREWNLWVMNADGTGETQYTFVAANTLPNVEPEWSPDDTQIVFESQFACCVVANREIHTIDADGSNNVRLTNNAVWDGNPFWSPDGTQILYNVGNPGSGTGTEVYRMDADGSNATRLTDNALIEYNPKYSPDGSKILFNTDRDGNWETYTMEPDGSLHTRLTTSPAGDSRLSDWSPDGTQIVFASDRAGTWDLYIMDADGSNVTQLTTLGSAEGMTPSWQ